MSITVFIYIDHPNGVPSEQTTNTFSEARGEPKSFNARCISHGTNRDNPHLYRYKDSARRAEKQIYLDKSDCTSAIEKTGLSLHSVCSNFAF
jgi:hypothetical protein